MSWSLADSFTDAVEAVREWAKLEAQATPPRFGETMTQAIQKRIDRAEILELEEFRARHGQAPEAFPGVRQGSVFAPHWWRVGKVQRWRQEASREVAEREAREYLIRECRAGAGVQWGASWVQAFHDREKEIEIIDEVGYRSQGGAIVVGGGSNG